MGLCRREAKERQRVKVSADGGLKRPKKISIAHYRTTKIEEGG